MKKNTNKKKEKCLHLFTHIKNSGKKTGISRWKCIFCKKTTKSN